MARKFVRIRAKNQITLPPDVVAKLHVGEDDYLQVEVTSGGVAQIAPARLAVLGTEEAREANRRAEEDFKAGRYREYENGQAFAKALFSREGVQARSEPDLPSRPIGRIEREIIGAAIGRTDRTARKVARAGAIARGELDDIAKQVEALKKKLVKASNKLKKAMA